MHENLSLILNLIPTVVIATFTGLQYWISKQKKKNDLFQIRYNFYKKVEAQWLSTSPHIGAAEGDKSIQPTLPPTWDDLIPIAREAKFLFGDDIFEHILSLEGKIHEGYPDFPEDWFIKPFIRYLSLK